MEDPTEAARVVPELYFLIAKFLSGGPLKETAKTLINELERVEVLPRRIDWLGEEHTQSYHELSSQYSDMSWSRLAAVCARALQLSRSLPPTLTPHSSGQHTGALAALSAAGDSAANNVQLMARLSLLSDTLVRPKPKYASYKLDHSLVRRLIRRECGSGPTPHSGGCSGAAEGVLPPRMLSGLRLQRRTLGHLSAVYCLVLDCTGRYVITGADDLLVKVWSATDGRLIATLRGAGAEITDVCVSHDGSLLACGSVERLVRVWCLHTAAPKAVLHAHQGTITSVHWAPPWSNSIRWLASTSTDGSVALWSCSAEGQFVSQPVQYVERMRPGPAHMICAAWSAGGGFLAAGSADHHVRVYCIDGTAPPRRVLEVAVHTDAVDSLSWCHRGLRFVSGSKDGSAALWTLHATQWRHTLLVCQPHDDNNQESGKRLKVTMVCWDCADRLILTACSDCHVRVWCARAATQLAVLRGHRDEAYVLESHPFLPGVILSAGHDGQLFVWDANNKEVLSKFHNQIPGQGDGAIFDAKWSAGGTQIAASDSHGHLLLLGLGQGHRLLSQLPTELFFHTDYRPLVRDALGGALDEQTETPPHLMAPPFLVDVEGAPHPPACQRLVPGRERLATAQLVPHDAARSRIDELIEILAAERGPHSLSEGRGVWRGEGVRHAGRGEWQPPGAELPSTALTVVPPLPAAHVHEIEETAAELYAWEMKWYRREMRRRPLMISTAGEGATGPRRKPGRRARAPLDTQRARPRPRVMPEPEIDLEAEAEAEMELDAMAEAGSASDSVTVSSDYTDRDEVSEAEGRPKRKARQRAQRPTPRKRDSDHATSSDSDISISDRVESHSGTSSDTHTSTSYSSSASGKSSSSSQYSDWEAGAALAPPTRARRKPVPANRYSPTPTTTKRSDRASVAAATQAAAPAPHVTELPELYRPGEWLCALSPRKAPYHPQMGDHCLYFRLGHQRYLEAVAEKDLYKVTAKDKPWERTHVYECEQVQVVGLKYVIRPPRVAALRLACSLPPRRTITVKYHDMADVIDFLVLRQQYDTATQRRWGQGDRFRCMIDDSWWTGIVLERVSGASGAAGPSALPAGPAGPAGDPAAASWAQQAASHFLSLRVRWDNGEVERLSPWDLEPLDPERLPPEPGGCIPVLPQELEAVLYISEPHEWPPNGDRRQACRTIAHHISQVMSLSAAEPFVAPVDLQAYPSYAMVVPYPIDLATVRARFDNLFYRRVAAAQFDVRYLASNAESFNEPHAIIVRQARLVTDLLLHIISNWRDVDVVGKYHELAAAYHSSDDEPLANAKKSSRSRGSRRLRSEREDDWISACERILRELTASADSEPFRMPVSAEQVPDYHTVVRDPMDLGTVSTRLCSGHYSAPAQLAADVRKVFTNSRLYNTNTRSRIYSMTVRLSSLFESLWSEAALDSGGSSKPRRRRPARKTKRSTRATSHRKERVNGCMEADTWSPQQASVPAAGTDSDSEPLADTSRRVHAARANRNDSWDSDVPLHSIHKGKGVGKKSKNGPQSDEPVAGPSRVSHVFFPSPVLTNGLGSGSSGSSGSGCARLAVLEEEVAEDVHLTYESESPPHTNTSSRKRRVSASWSSASDKARRARRKHHATPQKRSRERFTAAESSSSSSAEDVEPCGTRYESDHSYRPRYSTDDDQPLHMLRQRSSAGGSEPGPSGAAHNGNHKRLRARASRRYNEDSEEDSVAAISKRLPHHHMRLHRQQHTASRCQRHSQAAMNVATSALASDHDYYGGAPGRSGHGGHAANGRGHASGRAGNSARTTNGDIGGNERGTNSTDNATPLPPSAVSISSRGRVRKLTAKARGLLQD